MYDLMLGSKNFTLANGPPKVGHPTQAKVL